VSKAIKEGMVHHLVIRLTPVEKGQARQLTLLHSRPHCGIHSKEGICSTAPPAEAVLVVIELNMRAHPLQQQVREEFGDGRKECQATVVGTIGEIPRLRHRDKDSLPSAARDAFAGMYEIAQKQQELFALGATVLEQFGLLDFPFLLRSAASKTCQFVSNVESS
jgi:hypothetical protein